MMNRSCGVDRGGRPGPAGWARRGAVVAMLGALMGAPCAAVAQDEDRRGGRAAAGEGIRLNFREARVEAVLDHLSEVAGLVIVQQAPIEGRISVTSRQPLTVNEAVQVLNSVLRDKGLAAVRVGRTLRVVPVEEARRSNIPVHVGSDPDVILETDEVITQVIPLRTVDASQLREDLAPLLSEYADVTANAASNALVMTDTSANVRRIVRVISALDTSVTTLVDVRVVALDYANATDAARLVNELFGDERGGRNGARDRREAAREFFRQRGRGGADEGGAGSGERVEAPLIASADARTNTVVISGPPDVVDAAEDVLVDLDANPAAEQGVFTYSIRNGQALNIEEVLNLLFNGNGQAGAGRGAGGNGDALDRRTQGRGQDARPGNRPGGARGGGPGGARGGIGGGRGGAGGGGGGLRGGGTNRGATAPRSSADPSDAPVLLASDTPDAGSEEDEGVLVPVPPGVGLSPEAIEAAAELFGQVHVVADPDTNSLLIMTSPGNIARVRQILADLDKPVPQVLIKVLVAEVTHSDSLDLGVEFSILNIPRGSTLFTDFGVAAQPGGMVYRLVETDINATLRAIAEVADLEVLSRPYILASDNQPARITVGSEVPFIVQSRTTELGQTINTIQYDDIGIILDVIPYINPDGVVTMDILPEISAISGETVPISETVSAPVIAKRSAETRVAIDDGQTIVIGGLMEDQKTVTTSKVPLIGDIPLLGRLFRRDQTEKRKTELLIFLTPHVAHRTELLRGMSEEELEGIEIVPEAVEPGAYEKHLEGLRRGRAAEGEEEGENY